MPYKVQPFYNLDAAVGAGKPNSPADVLLVQYLLVKVASQTVGRWNPPGSPLDVDGVYTPNLSDWILSYQNAVGTARDGVVDPQQQAHWKHWGTLISLNASYRNHFGAARHDNLVTEPDCPAVLRGALSAGNAKPEMGTKS